MKRNLLSAFCLIFLAFNSEAQVPLDSCRVWARENFPLAQQYGLIAQSESYSISNASRIWLPRFSLSAQGTWQSDAMNLGDIMDGNSQILPPAMAANFDFSDYYMRQYQGKVQLELQQVIWDGGMSAAQKEMIRKESAVQAAQTDMEMRKMEERVDQIYFGILLLEEQEKQLKSLQELLASNLNRAKALCQNDMILSSDAETIEAEWLGTKQRLAQLQYSLKAYRKMLSLLCGKELEAETLEHLENDADLKGKESAEKSLLTAQKSALDAKERALAASTRPQLGAFAQGWYGYPSLNMFKSMKSAEWGLNAIVGLAFRWDLGSFYTLKNERQRINVARQQLTMKEDIVDFNDNLKKTQDEAEIQRLREILLTDKEIVDLRSKVRISAEAQHDNGTLTTAELLQKINDETQAQSNQALHQIELQKKIYEITHQ